MAISEIKRTRGWGRGGEARERSKMIPEFPGLGNWVDMMLFIKIGKAGRGAGLGGEGNEFISGTGCI